LNAWAEVLDNDKMWQLIDTSATRIIGRETLNRFKKQFSLYISIFEYASCDCLTDSTTCFGTGVIASPIDSCIVDPTSKTTCSGLTLESGTFPNGTSVDVEVSLVSAASYIAEGSQTLLQKRDVNITEYEVVKNGDGSIIGQIVGNGKQFTFEVAAIEDVNVCLDVDLNISQNNEMYTVKDFVESIDDKLGVPMQVTVVVTGDQYCANVPPFTTGTFVPVLRKDVVITQPIDDQGDPNPIDEGTPASAFKLQATIAIITPLIVSLLF
jgi:hypothetical protein